MSLDIFGNSISGSVLVMIPMLLAVAYSFYATAKDATRRGKDPFLAVLFIHFACWPLSYAWWRWLRPPLQQRPRLDLLSREEEITADPR